MIKSYWTYKTTNRKTGPVIQQYIGSTRDESKQSCTGCPLLENKGCYAQFGTQSWAHSSILRAKKDYSLRNALEHKLPETKYIRLGAIGDPSKTPVRIFFNKAKKAGLGVLGYTHFWERFPKLKPYLMASCDSIRQALRAVHSGWRATVYLEEVNGTHGIMHGVKWALCPAQSKPGKITCNSCGLCDASKKHLVPLIVFKKH